MSLCSGTLKNYETCAVVAQRDGELVTVIRELGEVLQASVETGRARHSDMAVAVVCRYGTSSTAQERNAVSDNRK
jgi:uncharacterized protein with PIN domain